MHIFIIGALPESLLNFRGELIKSMISKGHTVTALASVADPLIIEKIKKLGANFISFPVSRTSLNPISDFKTFLALRKEIKKNKPDIVLAYTIKPVIWGGIASRLSGVRFYAIITGLGFVFNGQSLKRKILGKVASFLYKSALKRAEAVIFQNIDNRDVFLGKKLVTLNQANIVDGSGVDSSYYEFSELPDSDFVFLCISRLLGEKGLREYANAASIVRSKIKNVSFVLVGPSDSSPDAIKIDEVASWVAAGLIQYEGAAIDVRNYIKKCHVYVLPSYHEGVPRSVLEAMSMGRPILTTDAVGCKETVENSFNGFKVPIKNAEALAEKMIWFIDNRNKLNEMGKNSRELIEKKFEAKIINERIFKFMKLGY